MRYLTELEIQKEIRRHSYGREKIKIKTLTFSHKSAIIKAEFKDKLSLSVFQKPFYLSISKEELLWHIKKDPLDINSYIRIPKYNFYKEVVIYNVKNILGARANKETLFLDIEVY